MQDQIRLHIEKIQRSFDTWLGSILGKVDRARKEQKYYAIAIILLQVINLIATALSLL